MPNACLNVADALLSVAPKLREPGLVLWWQEGFLHPLNLQRGVRLADKVMILDLLLMNLLY